MGDRRRHSVHRTTGTASARVAAPTPHKRRAAYLSATLAPASSSCFFMSSASALETASLSALGAASTISFASFRPRPVIVRTTLRTAIFLSAGNSSRTTSNSDFSSAASAGAPAAAGAAAIIIPPAGAADASTPNASSMPFTRSAASIRVSDLSSSRIASVFSDIATRLDATRDGRATGATKPNAGAATTASARRSCRNMAVMCKGSTRRRRLTS
mmetsp:Transcript_722/g.1905  ORF Transcript_722/g.1905 Transcript_722/m.1905 type:complete len:215 (+) Transcript_722:226-870(+)